MKFALQIVGALTISLVAPIIALLGFAWLVDNWRWVVVIGAGMVYLFIVRRT